MVLTLKKMPVRVVGQILFGQNEYDSPGDSTSDSSEKLLQRIEGEGQYMCDFREGEYMQSSTYFCRRFLLVTRNSCHYEGF